MTLIEWNIFFVFSLGEPIPGKHWLEYILHDKRIFNITTILIDFEVATSKGYHIDIFCENTNNYIPLISSNSLATKKQVLRGSHKDPISSYPVQGDISVSSKTILTYKHVIHNITLLPLGFGLSPDQRRLHPHLSLYTLDESSNYQHNPCTYHSYQHYSNTDHKSYRTENMTVPADWTQSYISRIRIHSLTPATQWGVSIWRILVWGYGNIWYL